MGMCHAGVVTDEDETVSGDGWRMLPKPSTEDYRNAVRVDGLFPDADWFWDPLQRWCVAECCGTDAFDFSPEFVQWVTHQSNTKPDRHNWRYEQIGDVSELAVKFRESASKIQALPDQLLEARRLNSYYWPAELADFFSTLADAIETGSDSNDK